MDPVDPHEPDEAAPDAPPPAAAPPMGAPPPMAPPPVPAPRPGGGQSDATLWAVGAHLSPLVASSVAGLAFLGPLIIWLVKRDQDAFVAEHARQSLNFQLTMLIAFVIAVVLAIVTFGIGLLLFIPLGIVWLVFMIMGTVAASKGEPYRYPLTIEMVK